MGLDFEVRARAQMVPSTNSPDHGQQLGDEGLRIGAAAARGARGRRAQALLLLRWPQAERAAAGGGVAACAGGGRTCGSAP